jgi:hypothetical protein
MKANGGLRIGRLLMLGGFALALAASGCSFVIAQMGVSSPSEIYKPDTRAEVRDAFGEADETGTCPDGRPVERRAIRQASCPGFKCVRSGGTADIRLLFDPLIVPFAVYASERGKLHYAFVYGADDRVVYRYNINADPATRFRQAVDPLTDFCWNAGSQSLPRQLTEGRCASWATCLDTFATEVRHRAACVGYPLTPTEVETVRLIRVLAAEVDAGHLASNDALAEFEWCLRYTPFSCFRP